MKLAGDILILTMMLLSNGRVLIIRKPHQDPLVMLAPLSFLLASLSLFAFSIDIFSVIILFISILVLLSNFHALFRYGARLIVDRYSVLMKIWAVVTTLLCGVTIITLLIFAPTTTLKRNSNITENQTLYSGSFSRGFTPAEKFSTANVFLTEFSKTDTENLPAKNVVLFMPDKRGDTISYKAFLTELAKEGFTVCSMDFYAKDLKWIHSIEDSRMCRKFGLIIRSLLNPEKFNSQKEFYTFNYTKEFEAALKLLQEKYGNDCKYILVTDNTGYTAAHDTMLLKSEIIEGIFDISTIPEYTTPGYGFIFLTDPLLYTILENQMKNKSKEKTEASFSSISSCAQATSSALKQIQSGQAE